MVEPDNFPPLDAGDSESAREVYRAYLTQYLDDMFIRNFTLKELRQLDRIYDLQLDKTFDSYNVNQELLLEEMIDNSYFDLGYFENRLINFKNQYNINSKNPTKKNLDAIQEVDLAMDKVTIPNEIDRIFVTSNKETDNLQSIDGNPAVTKKQEDGVIIEYFFINNQIICSSKFPGIVKYENYRKDLFFKLLPNGNIYVYKKITFRENNLFRVEYYDYIGNNVDYGQRPAYFSFTHETTIMRKYRKENDPEYYKFWIGNVDTGNYIKIDYENSVGEFNGRPFSLTSKELRKYRTSEGAGIREKLNTLVEKLVLDSKTHIDPKKSFPFTPL